MTYIHKDPILENIKKNYIAITGKNDFVSHSVIKETLNETRKYAPHLNEKFVRKHYDLIRYLNESYKEAKKCSAHLLLESVSARKKYIKEHLFWCYFDYNMNKSRTHDHLMDLISETYTAIFHPVKITNRRILLEKNVDAIKSKESDESTSTNFRFEFDPKAELDHKSQDDQDPSTVAYWKRVAQEEPNAEDIQPFIRYMKYYEKGYNPFLIYSIPEGEPGGYDPSKPMLPPKIQNKLYQRYKMKKSLKNRGIEEEEIQKILRDYDKENQLEEIISNISDEYQKYSSTKSNKADQGKEGKEGNKPGFFSKVSGWVKEKFKSMFANPKEAQKTQEELNKIEVSEKKKETWWTKIKNGIKFLQERFISSGFLKKFGLGLLKSLIITGVLWALSIATPVLGPIAIWLMLAIKLYLSLSAIFSSGKEIIKIINEMREGKSGLSAIAQVIKNLVNREYLAHTFFLLVHSAILISSFIGLKQTMGQVIDEAKKLGKYLALQDQKIANALEQAQNVSNTPSAQEVDKSVGSGTTPQNTASDVSTQSSANAATQDAAKDATQAATDTATKAADTAAQDAAKDATQAATDTATKATGTAADSTVRISQESRQILKKLADFIKDEEKMKDLIIKLEQIGCSTPDCVAQNLIKGYGNHMTPELKKAFYAAAKSAAEKAMGS